MVGRETLLWVEEEERSGRKMVLAHRVEQLSLAAPHALASQAKSHLLWFLRRSGRFTSQDNQRPLRHR